MRRERRRANSRTLIAGLGLILSVPLAHGDPADRAQSQANELAAALVAGEYMAVARLTHPQVVNRVGGPRAVASSLRNATLAAQLTLHRMEFSAPRQLVRAGDEYVAVMPYASEATLRGREVTVSSFYLGFSSDGSSWHFLDCQGVTHATIKRLVPQYDNALNLSGC